ncbi:MAG: polyprenyl diphosphate synthase [Sorangiineae bacterium]|nr:polyprenyl diphosphate synthase [Polyangiaceae bacterium]MEB2325061.1 polyprenyl diphosphate synthase [Sorangiineae bacterium]
MDNERDPIIPRHVAIIMDGNGRWAKARGLERADGHAEGARAVRDAVETAARAGVEYLTLYAFSVANWARPPAEVQALMRLLVDFAKRERPELRQNGIRLNVIGQLEELPTETRAAVEDLMRYTADGDRMTLTLALSYGGRTDIVEAARALAVRARAGLVLPEEIDESFFHREMSTASLPDVDLLLRTGGESRLSDFLLFEAAYAELAFLPIMWPDFRPQTLLDAIAGYGRKERRFGQTSEQLKERDGQAFDPPERV